MKLSALLDGLDAVRTDALGTDPSVDHVTIDSRKVRAGTLFVACPGATPASRDGHEFIDAAVEAGAAAVVVARGRRDAADGVTAAVPVVVVADPRKAAAVLAERAAGSPSSRLALVGVTGTNGKTTATWLFAQLMQSAGRRAAVLGTLGVGPVDAPRSLGFTTPEAEVLSAELRGLADEGFDVVAMEVSSHALATGRVDGLRFSACGFTNLTRDHLDFHGSMEAYFDAKARLFTALAPAAPALLPAGDDVDGWQRKLRALRPDAALWSVSPSRGAGSPHATPGVRAEGVALGAGGISGTLVAGERRADFSCPLLGAYNVDNVLVAAGLALALGVDLDAVARGLAAVKAPPGRLEIASPAREGPLVVVDYAHTPDALERALHAVRAVTPGKLFAVFGCGGDRDAGKRPLMGRVAAEIADAVVVTDDNPRSEDGDAIAAAVEAGVAAAVAAGTAAKRRVEPARLAAGTWAVERARRMAIRAAVRAAAPGDAVLVAGKGHERTQTIGARVLPFDDVTEARRALAGAPAPAFLDASLVTSALAGRVPELRGELPPVLLGVGTDSRAGVAGSLFVALPGERFDGHDFAAAALSEGRAGAALVSRAGLATRPQLAQVAPLLVVDDALLALQDIARAYLRTLPGRRVALTGSNGKTTTKELIGACLRAALGAPYVVTTTGNLNNHIGVPLTALVCEPAHKAMVFEMGMNHLGEIAALAGIVRPEVGLITNIGTAHQGNVGGVEGVARAKAELFEALPEGGVAVVNADDPRCVREAQDKAGCRQNLLRQGALGRRQARLGA